MARLVHFGVDVLEVLFFVGWIGAFVVLLLSAVEDIATITRKDEPSAR